MLNVRVCVCVCAHCMVYDAARIHNIAHMLICDQCAHVQNWEYDESFGGMMNDQENETAKRMGEKDQCTHQYTAIQFRAKAWRCRFSSWLAAGCWPALSSYVLS